MVFYSCKEIHAQEVLETAYELRESQQLCDIVLVVGSEKVHAHRNVLVAGSDYFRTLFLGPFNESSKDEVDLSSTTSDFPTFEKCITFLYTGEIEIDSESLENLMKMSSCFLMPKLQKFCSEFLEENLNLSTALKFYLYSMKYGFVKLETEIEAIVKSRFHDYFIFEDETLSISPDQLHHLFANNFLEFCSWDAMLKFLSDWISKTFTDQHLETVKIILETIETELIDTGNKLDLSEAKGQFFVVKDALEKLIMTLKPKKSPQGKQIVRKCQQLLKSLAGQNATEFLTQGFCKVKSRLKSKDELLRHTNNAVEDVLITISPRQSVIDAVNELRDSEFDNVKPWDKFVGPVLDVCSYNPRTKEWYYLYSLNDEMAASTILRSNSWYPWEYACVGDRIYCTTHSDSHKSSAYTLKLEDFSVSCSGFPHGEENMPNGFKPEWTRLFAAKESIYSLSLDTEIKQGNFIKCQKIIFGSTGPAVLHEPMFSVQKKQDGFAYRHIASLSPDCNELLIAVGDNNAEGAILTNDPLVQQSNRTIYMLGLKDKYKSEPRIQFWLQIVTGKDRFYIIEITKNPNPCRFEVNYRHAHEYGSFQLSSMTDSDSILYVQDNTLSPWRIVSPDTPLFNEHIFQHKGSVWIFTGNKQGTSSLFEIYEESDDILEVREHTPPPFPYILGAFSAQLSHGFLADKNRVTKYLLPK